MDFAVGANVVRGTNPRYYTLRTIRIRFMWTSVSCDLNKLDFRVAHLLRAEFDGRKICA